MHGYDKPFQVVRFDLHGNVKENILQYIHEGDTISVKIDSSEYRDMGEQTYFERYIEIHGLVKDGQEYLDIKQANKWNRTYEESVIPAGLFLLVAGLFYSALSKRPWINPVFVIAGGILLVMYIYMR